VRPGCLEKVRHEFSISIHTPAKGATFHFPRYWLLYRYFNPHTREGCDLRGFALIPALKFQSTHPRRVRRLLMLGERAETDISIHTPAKGATILRDEELKPNEISIHTPAKGATWKPTRMRGRENLFQSTHPRRVRQQFNMR